MVDQGSAVGSGLGSRLRARITGARVHDTERGSLQGLASGGGGSRLKRRHRQSWARWQWEPGLSYGRSQGKGHTRAAAGTGGPDDGGVGLWNAGRGGRARQERGGG